MLAVIFILLFILAVSLYSEIHALGFWLVLMISHKFVAIFVGSSAEHLPLLASLIVVAAIFVRRKWTGIPKSMLLMITAIFVVMTAAAIVGVESERSLLHVLWYSKGFVLAILIAGTIKSSEQVQILSRYFLAGVIFAVFVTFFEEFTGTAVVKTVSAQRAGWFTGNPNGTAALMVSGIPISLYWATHSRQRSYAIAQYALIVLLVGAITLTQSRGGGFVSLLLVMFLLYIRKPSIRSTFYGLIMLAGGLLLFTSYNSDYWDRIGTIVEFEDDRGSSLDKRKYYVLAGMRLVLDNPGLGVGMGNFGRAMIAADPTYRETDENRVAHNMYLEFIVENGIFGGLFFITLLGIGVIESVRYDKRSQSERSAYGLGYCIAMSLVALLISGLFISHAKSAILWFFVGLGFAFLSMARSGAKSRSSQFTNNLIIH